jgi:hypothetical protein
MLSSRSARDWEPPDEVFQPSDYEPGPDIETWQSESYQPDGEADVFPPDVFPPDVFRI